MGGVLGLRWSEAMGLRVRDVDFLRRTVTVAQTVAEVEGRVESAAVKTRSSGRTLSAPAFLVDELAAHVAAYRWRTGPEDLVFTGPKDGLLRRSFAARVFAPAVRKAGLDEGLTFHGLRHVPRASWLKPASIPGSFSNALATPHRAYRWSCTPKCRRPLIVTWPVILRQFAFRSGTQRARGVSQADRSNAHRCKPAGEG